MVDILAREANLVLLDIGRLSSGRRVGRFVGGFSDGVCGGGFVCACVFGRVIGV